MSDVINVGSLVADLDLDTSRLDRGVKNAEMGLLAVQKSMRELDDALMSGKVSVQEYTKQALQLAEAEKQLNYAILAGLSATGAQAAALAKAGASWNNYASAAGGASKSANRAADQMGNGWARAGMQFGYMVDDIQYGFQSIVNNVGPFTQSLAMGFGASAAQANAWGAGVQVAAVAAYQLYNRWDDFLALAGIPTVRTEAEEMENLANKTRKTADETERLNKYKKEQAEIESLINAPSKEEQAQEKGVRAAIAEAGGKKVVGELAKGMGASITPEEQAEIRDLEDRISGKAKPKEFTGMLGENEGATLDLDAGKREEEEKKRNVELLEARTKQIQDRITEENAARAGKLLHGALTDAGELESFISKVEKNPKAYPAGLAGNLRAATPDALKRQQEVKDEDADIDRMSEEAAKAEDKAEKLRRDKEQADRKAEAERKRERRETIANAKVDNPGIDAAAQGLAMGAMTGRLTPQEAVDRIERELMKHDQQRIADAKAAAATPDEADDLKADTDAEKRAQIAAQAILKDAGRDIKGDDLGEFPQFEMDRKVSSSQQFNAADLAGRVQAGVNNEDDTKKMVDYLNKCQQYLEKLAAKNSENPWAGFQEK